MTGPRTPRALVRLADALSVVLAMLAAYTLHALLWRHVGFIKAPADASGFVLLAYLAMPVWLVLVWALDLDRPLEIGWSPARTAWRLIGLHLLGLAVLSAVTFATKTVVNRSIVASFLLLSFVFMLALRLALRLWAKRQHARGNGRQRLLLVGEPGPAMTRLMESLAGHAFPPEVVGYLGRRATTDEQPRRLGTLAQLPAVLHDEAVDSVIVLEQLSQRRAGWLVQVCADLGLDASVPLPWRQFSRLTPQVDADARFLSFGFSTRRTAELAVKQILDLGLGLLALLLLLPLLAGVALAILLIDGRPVIYSQQRVGLHGRRFRMLKFRTMVKDADALKDQLLPLNEVDGPAFKVSHDPRVTAFGEFLRKTSIDELPQLWNVLEGSMSLVGPRPLPVSEQQNIHGAQRRRLSMKPGITGLWQVSGRSDVDFAEWMRLDQEYVDRWSLALDIKLLLATIPAVLLRRGAK
jgi:exopolysaccharide biosynthesis polyprenyl glycosylphosphotransferase